MAELTEEEQRILALMKQLDAATTAATPPPSGPAQPVPERLRDLAFFDQQGQPYPLREPPPTDDEAAARNRELIVVLEEQLKAAQAGTPVQPPGPTRRR